MPRPEQKPKSLSPAAWIMFLAGGLVVAAAFLAVAGVNDLRAERLVDDRTMCASSGVSSSTPTDGSCLERLTGQLTGPHYTRRSPGDEWRLTVDGEAYDEFDVNASDNDELAASADPATVLSLDGDVVAVYVTGIGEGGAPDGGVVPVWSLGTRGAAEMWMFGLLLLGGAVGAASYAWRKRRANGSWWLDRPDVPPVSPASPWATLMLLPAGFGLLAVVVGVPWWPVWVAVYAATFVGMLVVLPPWSHRWDEYRGRRTPPAFLTGHRKGRHSAQTD